MNIEPWLKPNWAHMHAGQRRYAVEQYNRARANRHLPPLYPPPHLDDVPDDLSPDSSDFDESVFDNIPDQEDTVKDTSKDTSKEPQAGPSHRKSPDHISNSPSMSKRPIDHREGELPGKVLRTGEPVEGTPPVDQIVPVRDNAMEVDGNVQPTRGASGGTGMFVIPRNIRLKHKQTMIFGKTFRFFTFGFGNFCITRAIGATPGPAYTQYFMTTSLAEIPVHLPVLYLNPVEYSTLPLGAYVESIEVNVFQRNPLIQFETASSATKQATINQVKQCIHAQGLNLTMLGENVFYSGIDATEKMKPTAVSQAIYNNDVANYPGLQNDLYGIRVNDTGFATQIPVNALGIPTTLKNYWCWTQNSKNGAVGAHNCGWPDTTQYFKQWDGADSINAPVATYFYKPKIGFLSNPIGFIYHQLPANKNPTGSFGKGSWFSDICEVTIDGATAAVDGVSHLAATTDGTTINNPFNLYTPIEKSNHYCKGLRNHLSEKTQPSLHVGIMPVPAFSADNILVNNNSFDDARVEFVVETKMIVKFDQRSSHMYGTAFDIPVHERIYQRNIDEIAYRKQNTFDGIRVNVNAFDD